MCGASAATLQDARVSVIAEVARNYFVLRGLQDQLALTSRNADNQLSTLKLTRVRLEAGRGNELDTARAEAQWQTTLASIPTLEASIATTIYRLSVLTGRQPAALNEQARAAGADAGAAGPEFDRHAGAAAAAPAGHPGRGAAPCRRDGANRRGGGRSVSQGDPHRQLRLPGADASATSGRARRALLGGSRHLLGGIRPRAGCARASARPRRRPMRHLPATRARF